MKKVLYTLLLLVSAQTLSAQGFLNKIKSKINSSIEKTAQPAQQQQPAQSQGISYTDPTQYGTLILTYSKPEIAAHMGGDAGAFDLWFQNVSVTANQLHFQMVDYDKVYDYTGGKVVKTGATTTQHENDQHSGSELDYFSKDFTQLDMQNAMLKKGTHVGSGMLPGKPLQTLTFNGKAVGGSFYTYSIAHNYDSTAVAVAGTTIANGGMKSSLTTSNGQNIPLPNATGSQCYISPDGKIAAAIVMINIPPGESNVYLSNGTKTFFKNGGANNLTWLRNSGSLFYVGGDQKTLYRNGDVYHTFDDHYQDDPKTIFIGKDDKNMCWVGDHALCFSDGTKFENASSPHKITIDNKEVVIFLAVNVTSGEVYLCRHDL